MFFRGSRRRAATFAAVAIVGVGGAAVALADDDVGVDRDIATPGLQNGGLTLSAIPGQTLSVDVGLYVACSNGAGSAKKHLGGQTTLTYSVGASTIPTGGAASATSVTLTQASGWPADGAQCPSGGIATAPATSTVTLTAPAVDGTYDYIVGYISSDTDVSSTGGDSKVKIKLTVTAPEPSDTSRPVITPTVTGPTGENGWYTGPVTVSWNVVDKESEITSMTGCGALTVTANTTSATSNCSATSAGGTSTDSVTFKIDQNAPSVSGTPTTSTISDDWYNAPVTIDWTCLELGPSGLAGACPDNSTIDGEGRGLTVDSPEVKDNAGNATVATSAPPVNIDKTAPGVTGTLSAFAYDSGSTKWWKDSATVSWVATDPALDNGDAPSGVATQPTETSVSTDGLGQTSSQSAMDRAGNTGTGNVGDINVDRQAPTVTAEITSTPAYLDWFKDKVEVQVAASDPTPGSGLATNPSGTETRSASGSFDATATDNVGHSTKSITVSFKVDGTGPNVTLDCNDIPPTVYKNDLVSVDWSATDGQSGLAGAAAGSISLDTATVGAKSAQVASGATSDNVGHPSAASNACGYAVVYKFAGFFQPIDNDGVLNKVKAGSTVPVKFSLGGNQGLGIFESGSPSSIQFTCPLSAVSDPIEEVTTTTSGLKYDATADQYNYAWKTQSTWSGQCRRLTVQLNDGTPRTALFQFTK